jgi:hypothetical protein
VAVFVPAESFGRHDVVFQDSLQANVRLMTGNYGLATPRGLAGTRSVFTIASTTFLKKALIMGSAKARVKCLVLLRCCDPVCLFRPAIAYDGATRPGSPGGTIRLETRIY